MIGWVPELEVQMVGLTVQLKMMELMQLLSLPRQLESSLELIRQELLAELLRLSVLVGWHC